MDYGLNPDEAKEAKAKLGLVRVNKIAFIRFHRMPFEQGLLAGNEAGTVFAARIAGVRGNGSNLPQGCCQTCRRLFQ